MALPAGPDSRQVSTVDSVTLPARISPSEQNASIL